jgi:hypothetical protein
MDNAMVSDPDAPTPPEISLANIRWQFTKDIDTKEVQTSPTYSYQWVADQVGHMALGLAAVLLGWLVGDILRWFGLQIPDWPPPVIGFLLFALGAGLWERRTFRQACEKIHSLFDSTCDRKDLRDNAVAATYYMIVGGLIGLLAVLGGKLWPTLSLAGAIATVFAIVIVFALAIVLPALYWLRQKIRFQQVGLPFLFRLPEFKLEGFDPNIAKRIDEFIRNSGAAAPKHIAILGELGTGKTSLAVGIATEAAFNDKKARYLTLDKLQQIARLTNEPPSPRNTRLWPWRESQLIVIDDVVSGIPDSVAEHPDQLLKELQDLGEPACRSLRRRNTVWCLGADTTGSDAWIETLLQGSGIAEQDLLIVVLQKTQDPAANVRASLHPLSSPNW